MQQLIAIFVSDNLKLGQHKTIFVINYEDNYLKF